PRLWPLSRELHPKQLLTLTGTHTMLQETLLRLEGLPASPPVVVCNEAHRFLVAEQLRQLKLTPSASILEPFGRNTAPAIALAAHAALVKRDGGGGARLGRGLVSRGLVAGPALCVFEGSTRPARGQRPSVRRWTRMCLPSSETEDGVLC